MGGRIMVSYHVHPDQAALNEELVRGVYEELEQSAPDGFHYATFVKDDGVSFVHIASHKDDDSPLLDLAAFQAFQAGIKDRCQEPPVRVDLREIGSYRFWGM